MTNEFKKISKNNETRYVLEDGSSTTGASVASIDTPLGGMQRRTSDNILAQEADKKKLPATKPRNFVAKNAKMGGAGQHKDKKKAQKQGDVKHKKPLAENVDNLEIALQQARQITKMIKYDDTVTDIVVKIQALAEKFNIDANDIRYAIDDVYETKQKLESVVYGLDEIFEDALRNARYAADDETDFNEDWGKGGYDTYSAGNHGRGVAEEDDVQQELGMAGSELYGIAKHAKELLALIKQHGQQQGLEAWQQSKITKAADYLNAVLQSLDYDTHGDEQGVAEGAPELLKKEMPLHRHAEKLLAQNGVSKDDPDYHHHLNNTIKHLRQFGNIDLINKSDEQGVAEAAKHGLYYNVNKRKKAGTSRPASSPKAPTAQAWKDAAKTAKKESVAESEGRCMQCGMKNCKCPGDSCKCKPVAGWVPGKGFKKAMDEAAKKQTMSRAAKGMMKYGKDGMKALAKAGRDGASDKKLDAIRDKHDNYNEEWSQKYKSSINCSHPKGFSQKAHCAGKKKHEESMMTMEMVCEDCGMCQTHGNVMEIKKGAKDSNGVTKCWPGHHAAGTKKGKNGGQVRNCVPNESTDPYFESLSNSLAEKLDSNAPVDDWIQDFQKADPNKYHQFKNKTPEKKTQMAVAASYGAKNPSKKK
jgi:hypothetical protein